MKILIIEDNITLVNTLKDVFVSRNYEVEYFTDLDDIDDYIILNSYDIIILDLMLGKYDGLKFLKDMRNEIKTPFIILTAKDTKEDIINGFNCGAADYITKPFDIDILIARVNARSNKKSISIKYKDTLFDFERFVISHDNNIINLTFSESEILKYLLQNIGKFISKESILNSISNSFDSSERAIVSHIYNIRQKILSINADDPIENRWKVGYRWKED